MRLTFDANTGYIIQTVYDRDIFSTKALSGAAAFTDFDIDEVAPNNKDLCFDLARSLGRTDNQGRQKYYMVNNAGIWELHETDGWTERAMVTPI